jgi:hypothetical protein
MVKVMIMNPNKNNITRQICLHTRSIRNFNDLGDLFSRDVNIPCNVHLVKFSYRFGIQSVSWKAAEAIKQLIFELEPHCTERNSMKSESIIFMWTLTDKSIIYIVSLAIVTV